MDDKLKLFLEKIKINEEKYKYFKEGKIIKIKSSKDRLNWNFIIETKELLPLDVIKFLDENISAGFPNLNTVTYTIVPKKTDKMLVNNYFNYIVSTLELSKAMSNILIGKIIKFTTNGLCIEVDNKAMENLLNNNIERLENKYKQIGFDIKLNVVLNEEEIKNEINDLKIDTSKLVIPKKQKLKKEKISK